MTELIAELPVGPIPRLVARGPRSDAFRALGARAAASIRCVLDQIPDLAQLRQRLERPAVRSQFDAVAAASHAQHPAAWADLEALAEGAEVEFAELLLLNLRGDLGTPAGAGCSDLAWRNNEVAYIAHNEDDQPLLRTHCRLLTLELDGEPAVTSWWTPGFLPANTWAITEPGLVYTIDHLNVVHPAHAAGRHFVARGLQRAGSIGEAVDWLRAHPSAGGFTYTLGQLGSGAITTVETAAGECAACDLSVSDGLRWHTNHVRYLRAGLDSPPPESRRRGDLLAALDPPGIPGADWFAELLTSPPPAGVHRDARDDDVLATHCTLVVELRAAALTLITSDGRFSTTSEEILSVDTPKGIERTIA